MTSTAEFRPSSQRGAFLCLLAGEIRSMRIPVLGELGLSHFGGMSEEKECVQ